MSEKSEEASPHEGDEESADTLEAEAAEVQKAVSKLSQEHPKAVEQFTAMMGMGPLANPLHHKMDGEHIKQMLELAANHDEREYNLHRSTQDKQFESQKADRRVFLTLVIIGAILFCVVLFLFRENPDVLMPVLAGLGGFLTGWAGGYGYSKSKE